MSRLISIIDGYPVGGYRIDRENYPAMESTSTDVSRLLRSKFRYPRELDPRPHTFIEDQGPIGSCVGNSGTSVLEHCFWIDTGGDSIQLSRAYGYYATQKIDGLTGDVGATINGFRKLASEYGAPPESEWPYSGRYDPSPPGGWDKQHAAAEPFKIRSHTVLASAKDVLSYLRAGAGGVHIGISWGQGCDTDSNGIFRWSTGGGGHALAFLGYTEKQREVHLWMANSWGRRWGLDGWALVSMRTVEQMLRDRNTVMVGLSDMAVPDVRNVDFSKDLVY